MLRFVVGTIVLTCSVAYAQPESEPVPESPPEVAAPPPTPAPQTPTPEPPQAPAPVVVAETPLPPPKENCQVRFYLEPSAHVVALTYSDRPYYLKQPKIAGSFIGRFRFGVHLDGCAGRVDLRAAGLLMVTDLPTLDDQFGFGGELEAGFPLVGRWTLGPRVGIESPKPITHISAGARLRWGRAVWFSIDAFYNRPKENQSFPRCADQEISTCNANVWGLTVGAGYGGKPGVITGAVAGGLFLLAIAAFAGAGT